MRLRVTKVDEYQFLTCVKFGLWGSKNAKFAKWEVGDRLAFIVNKRLAALAEVSGRPFVGKDEVWENGVFPHRIPLTFTNIIKEPERPPILGIVRDEFVAAWGPSFGLHILNQSALEDSHAETVARTIQAAPNALEEYKANLDEFLAEAKARKTKRGRPRKAKPAAPTRTTTVVAKPAHDVPEPTPAESSAHTTAQGQLIVLGGITNCKTWVATNDQNKKHNGKALADSCLQKLPKMGLSEEATRRISLIDVIWIKQSSPVCVFEIETTTSVYSGLLRLSDLISVVPSLNIRLYIVAPPDRKKKVLSELARPTFRRIGLNDYCQYVSTDDLADLLGKVGGLAGYIDHGILDTIATSLDDGDEAETLELS